MATQVLTISFTNFFLQLPSTVAFYSSFPPEQEAQVLGGKNHQHMTEDLFQSIKKGNFPSWTLHIQQMTREQGEALPYDPLE